MRRRYDIVVAGAGSIGLAFAALLRNADPAGRLAITVVDRQAPPPPGEDIGLRVSALSPGSMALLARLGLRDQNLLSRACPYRDMRVWDARSFATSPDALHFSAAEMALPELGHIVEDAVLRHRLHAWLVDAGVTLRYGAGIAAVDAGHSMCRVELEDGTTLDADLLAGADGGRSVVREAAGLASDDRNYAQRAIVTHVRPERDHEHTAWQRFLPDGPLALLPLADGRVSIVWSTGRAGELEALDDAAFGEALTAASDAVLGSLETTTSRASFPLAARHVRDYVRPRIALIGDAAHTVHPLAGQGANLGLADAAALAGIITDAVAANEHPGDLPVLRRYQRARRGSNALMLNTIDGLQRLFSVDSGWLSALRTTGMRLFNHSGPLKDAAMRVALGLEQEPPR